jgi:p-aminobenzoyl-glutamate transporter AbgT
MTKTVAIMMVLVFVVAAIVGGGVVYWLKPSTEVRTTVNVDEIRKLEQLTAVEYRLSAWVEQEYWSDMGPLGRALTDYGIARCTGLGQGQSDD